MTTTASSEVLVLDVGHGNCALILGGDRASVVDAPTGPILLDSLKHYSVQRVLAVFVSHADEDHIGGVIGLLSDPAVKVDAVYVNPDAAKATKTWEDFRHAVKDARKRHGLNVFVSLVAGTACPTPLADCRVEVLWPTPEVALGGVGGKDLNGRRLSSNSMSAVLRVLSSDQPLVLLAGDLDAVGLQGLAAEKVSLQSKVLVFPHHGGRPGSADPEMFAKSICGQVMPETVIFSIGRVRLANPQPAIVAGVRSALPSVHIVCTQLSSHCANVAPKTTPAHLGSRPSDGHRRGHACGGTLLLDWTAPHGLRQPVPSEHTSFVTMNAPSALCLGLKKPTSSVT